MEEHQHHHEEHTQHPEHHKDPPTEVELWRGFFYSLIAIASGIVVSWIFWGFYP